MRNASETVIRTIASGLFHVSDYPDPKQKPKVTQKSGSDAKRLRDAGRRVPQGKEGAKTDKTVF
jgi:hypothetical protein